MKKITSLFLIVLTLLSTAALFSCGRADIDITHKENAYSDLSELILHHEKYIGKSIALNSTYTVTYSFAENKIIRHTLLEFDTTGKKRALYEVRKSDGNYPAIGSYVTVIGTLAKDRYIDVEKFEGEWSVKDPDINTLDMSAAELNKFISDFRNEYSASEHHGKTVSIFGHLSSAKNYNFLIGLDKSGQYLWEIELHDPTGKIDFPKAEGNTVNPVHIIGELTTYVEDNITYACIRVESVARVESVFTSAK